MIVQLTTDVIDYVLSAFVGGSMMRMSLQNFEIFQPGWILVLALLWLSLRQTLANFSVSSPGRIIGLMHAVSSCCMGIPIILLLCSTSFEYEDMFQSFVENTTSIKITTNVMTYSTVGYFFMDSFFIARTAYLKHHIGAIVVYMLAAYHHETSLVHGACAICLFELGAILVQMSRIYPNLFFRTLICIGYSCTRLSLAWYYGFIFHTCKQFWNSCSLAVQLSYIPIFACLIFLLGMNLNWCYLQWKSLIKAYKATDVVDFYTFHQKIIGNC